jgi:HlyD family secretion protein
MRTLFGSLLIIGLLTGGGVYYVMRASTDPPAKFRTATIKRGDLISTITATGTVEPEEVVDVGAQVTGPVKALGPDPKTQTKSIDYRSVVVKGQVLAEIDESVYQAQLDQAKANLAHAEADMGELQAHLEQAKAEFDRAKSLLPKAAIAQTDYDVDLANYKVAEANLKVGEATIKQNVAAQAMAQRNFDYCTIKSPVNGTIVDRRISVGQTVVSNLSATSLFLIAKDLRRMQIWASVNEADIGRIHEGMPVQFAVDAYPNEIFHGTVTQIRFNATMTQNVVTYTVVVTTDNADLRLLPYLTANVSFQVEQHANVLYVPNGALRWKPRPQDVVPEFRDSLKSAAGEKGEHAAAEKGKAKTETAPGDSTDKQGPASAANDAKPDAAKEAGGHDSPRVAKEGGGGANAAAKGAKKKDRKTHSEHGQIWVKDGDLARPIEVRIGASDSISTEISGPAVSEDMEVILGYAAADRAAGTTNPFAPKLFNKTGGAPKGP